MPKSATESAAVVQQDVLGLDVAVDHALAVGVVEGAAHLAGNPHRVGDGELFLAVDPVADRLSRHIRHHVEEEAVRRPAVEEGQDMRMLQVGGGLDFAQEAFSADDRGQLRPQHLDGDLAVVLQVGGEVDGGHAALAELPLDAVAVGQGGGEAIRRGRLHSQRCTGEAIPARALSLPEIEVQRRHRPDHRRPEQLPVRRRGQDQPRLDREHHRLGQRLPDRHRRHI